jgi:AcrR family transcriptional regulator
MKRSANKHPSKRDQLIDTALRLFAEHGYRATGIDTILKEAGIAKMTLYHHFKSKDELIEAALRRRDEEWRAWFKGRVEERAQTSRARLLAIFDVLEEWFRRRDYHGCSFCQAATEFRDPENAIHKLAAEHKRILHDYVERLAEGAGVRDPVKVADQVSVLIDGAVITMEIFRKPGVARTAKAAAEQLLQL